MGGCNPCAAPYHHENRWQRDYVYSQYGGYREIKLFQDRQNKNSIEMFLQEREQSEEKQMKDIRECLYEYLEIDERYDENDLTERFKTIITDTVDAVYEEFQDYMSDDIRLLNFKKTLKHNLNFLTGSFMMIGHQLYQKEYKDKGLKPWQLILAYCKLVDPQFEAECEEPKFPVPLGLLFAQAFNQKTMPRLKKSVTQMTKEQFMMDIQVEVSKKLHVFCRQEWQYIENSDLVINLAIIHYYRMKPWDFFNAQQLIIYFNVLNAMKLEKNSQKNEKDKEGYFKGDLYKKDENDRDFTEQLMYEAIKAYEKIRDSNDMQISYSQEDELVAFSTVNDTEIYRAILDAIFTDVQGNEFKHDKDYSHKLSCLAMIVKQGAKQEKTFMGRSDKFTLTPGDMNTCADLIRIRLDKLRFITIDQTWGAEQIHTLLDVLNTVLHQMYLTKLKGLSENAFDMLKDSLEIFIGSIDDRAFDFFKKTAKNYSQSTKTLIEYVNSPNSDDEQESRTHKMGFKAQAQCALQAVNRIQQYFTSDLNQTKQIFSAAVDGTINLAEGILKMDEHQIEMGANDLGIFSIQQYDKSPKEWYDFVFLMFRLKEESFETLVDTLFKEDRKMNEILNFDTEARIIVTYYAIKCLDEIIRDRSQTIENRMLSIQYMRYIFENKNLETNKKLRFLVALNMQFFIKIKLNYYIRLKQEADLDENKQNRKEFISLSDFAKEILYSVHENTADADKYVQGMIQQYSNRQLGVTYPYKYSDHISKGNKSDTIYTRAFRDKHQIDFELSKQRTTKSEEYLVRMKGDKYLDGQKDLKEKKAVDIILAVQEFLLSKQRTMLISGNKGEGKSTILEMIAEDTQKRIHLAKTKYTPMIIKAQGSADLSKAIQDQYGFKGGVIDTISESSSGARLLLLIDDCDQLKNPSNTLEINNFEKLSSKCKFIYTSSIHRIEDIDYKDLFKLPHAQDSLLLEYRFAQLDKEQIEKYIKYRVAANKKIMRNPKKALEHDYLSLYLDQEIYKNIVQNLRLKQIMKTPLIMKIIIDAIPKLKMQFDDSDIQENDKRILFHTNINKVIKYFIKDIFEKKSKELSESKNHSIPTNYSFEESCNNYTCSLAIDMWVHKMDSVSTLNHEFSFPFATPDQNGDQQYKTVDQEFQKYFPKMDSLHTKLARHGTSQIIDSSSQTGVARFTAIFVQHFFVAKVLYTYLDQYDEGGQDHIPIEQSYLNKRLFYEVDELLDSEVIIFLEAKIRYRMQKDRCNVIPNLKHIVKKIKIENLDTICFKNVLILSSLFDDAMNAVPENIVTELFKQTSSSRETGIEFKVKLLMSLYKRQRAAGNQNELKNLLMEAIGIQLKGEYEGDHKFGQMKIYHDSVFAHGKGKIKYDDQSQYTGEFKDGKKHGEGQLTFSNASLPIYFRSKKQKKSKNVKKADHEISMQNITEKKYQGQFMDDKMHGKGSLEYTLGSQYIGMFVENQKQGMGSFYYSADEYEYHGEWSNDKREGNGVFLSKKETNQFLYKGRFLNGQFHGRANIYFGQQSRYPKCVFEGKFMHGASEIGKMKISKDESFEGTLNFSDNQFEFTFLADIKTDTTHSLVYYEQEIDKKLIYYGNQLQDDLSKTKNNEVRITEIEKEQCEDEEEATEFFENLDLNDMEKIINGKILIVEGYCHKLEGLDETIKHLLAKAKLDKVLLYSTQGEKEDQECKNLKLTEDALKSKFKKDQYYTQVRAARSEEFAIE